MKPLRSRGLVVLTGVVLGCLIVFVVEVACRRYMDRIDPAPTFYHGLMTFEQPPLDWALRARTVTEEKAYMREVVMTTDTYGFRYPQDPVIPKPPGTVRIFVLGASAGFGLYVQDDETFSSLLEKYLTETVGRVEVINACVPGYSAVQELQMLVFRVLPFDPDIVILFDGFNDLSAAVNSNATLTPFGWENDMVEQFHRRRDLADQSIFRLAIADFSAYSGIFRMIRHVQTAEKKNEGREYRDVDSAAVQNYRMMVQTMAAAARGHGSEVIVAPQPNLFYGKNSRTGGELSFIAQEQNKRPNLWPLLRRYTPLYVAAAKEAAGASGAGFLDLTEAFKDASSPCLLDMVHPTPHGHLMIAKRLLREIESILYEKSLVKGPDVEKVRQSFERVDRRIQERLDGHSNSVMLAVGEPKPDQKDTYLENIRFNLSKELPNEMLRDQDLIDLIGELERHPHNGLAHNDLATYLMVKRSYRYAIRHYQEALMTLPGDLSHPEEILVTIHNNLGYALYVAGDRDEAKNNLLEALKLDPHYSRAHFNLGLLYFTVGNLTKARNYFSEALRLDPRLNDAREFLEKVDRMIEEKKKG